MFYKVIIIFHNAFFFQLQLTPDSTHSWFPTLDTSCSSRALCTACAHHQLQFGALNARCCCSALGTIIQKQFPESKYTPESKHVSEFGIREVFEPCFGFWKVLTYEPLDCVSVFLQN